MTIREEMLIILIIGLSVTLWNYQLKLNRYEKAIDIHNMKEMNKIK